MCIRDKNRCIASAGDLQQRKVNRKNSTEQATPAETTAESVETTQSEQPAEVQETPQKNAQQESTEIEQAAMCIRDRP